jgi:hypothetical protein
MRAACVILMRTGRVVTMMGGWNGVMMGLSHYRSSRFVLL